MAVDIVEGINPRTGSTYFNVIYDSGSGRINLVYTRRSDLPPLGDIIEEVSTEIDQYGSTNKTFRRIMAMGE